MIFFSPCGSKETFFSPTVSSPRKFFGPASIRGSQEFLYVAKCALLNLKVKDLPKKKKF